MKIILIFALITISCKPTSQAHLPGGVNLYKNIIKNKNYELLDNKFIEKDLYPLTPHELRILRNIYYARKGYRFKSKELEVFFSNNYSYKARYKIEEIQLTEMEKQNIKLIKKVELDKKNEIIEYDSYLLYNISLPNAVKNILEKIGEPSNTIYSMPGELSPVGQKHIWEIENQNLILTVIGDDYTGNKNIDADVRILILEVQNNIVDNKTIFGFQFNKTTMDEVERLFLITTYLKGDSIGEIDYVVFFYNQHWFTCGFNSKNKLVSIMQTSADTRIHPSLSP